MANPPAQPPLSNASRRHALQGLFGMAAALGGGCALPTRTGTVGEASAPWHRLVAAPSEADITRGQSRPTRVWAYNNKVPTPSLRLRQGERLQVRLANQLPDATTIHWHGLRLPNAMDGVPHLTQAPVLPGESFDYRFEAKDAGTYWFHPHAGTPEQVGRGLYGALIVEEPAGPDIDRELVWILDDWRLDADGQIVDDFYAPFDISHAGRLGNSVTINGQIPTEEDVRHGDRIRLRLINAANARVFHLQFEHHPAWILALDGQPLAEPAALPPAGYLSLAPGQRADLIIDMLAADQALSRVIDRFTRAAYEVTRFRYRRSASLVVPKQRGAPAPLPPNPLPAWPGPDNARRIAVVLDGGMHGVRPPNAGHPVPSLWSINGQAHHAHGPEHGYLFDVPRGTPLVLEFDNRSRWWHPMHLHGHVFVELSRNGRPMPAPVWRDTTFIAPNEKLTVGMVADNPGAWLMHCHILEHHAGGMGTQFRVSG